VQEQHAEVVAGGEEEERPVAGRGEEERPVAGGEEEELEAVEPAQAWRGARGGGLRGVLRRPAAETTARPASSDAMAAWATGSARVSSSPTALHGRPWRPTSKGGGRIG